MKVKELIALLKHRDGELEVFAYSDNDCEAWPIKDIGHFVEDDEEDTERVTLEF